MYIFDAWVFNALVGTVGGVLNMNIGGFVLME